VLTCATRIFDAATIFMALVIFWMFVTERMRCLTAHAHAGRSQRLACLLLVCRARPPLICLPAAKSPAADSDGRLAGRTCKLRGLADAAERERPVARGAALSSILAY